MLITRKLTRWFIFFTPWIRIRIFHANLDPEAFHNVDPCGSAANPRPC